MLCALSNELAVLNYRTYFQERKARTPVCDVIVTIRAIGTDYIAGPRGPIHDSLFERVRSLLDLIYRNCGNSQVHILC